MNREYNCKYFEFSKHYFKNPEKFGYLDLYQVGELELSANSGIPEHTQVCCEISYVLSGEGSFFTGNTEIPVKAGDIHIISKGAAHTIRSGGQKNLRFAFLGFDFNSDFPHGTLGAIKELFCSNPEKTVHDSGEIGQLFGMLIGETYSEKKNSLHAAEALMNYILILTERLFAGDGTASFSPRKSESFVGQPLYDILRFIDGSIPECPGVGEICRRFNYSESYVSHLFKEKTGMSIQNYIIDAKMKHSQKLLGDGKLSIAEIAANLGYASSRSFCKSFRAKFGCTPTDYRRLADEEKKADKDTFKDISAY